MNYWPLQDAKAQLSKLIQITLHQGPQGISIRGQEQVVLINKVLYDQLTNAQRPFTDFMQSSPLHGCDLDIDRDRSFSRDVEL
jgi:antitoxin Phd